jgi:hypothetical protein
MVARSGAADKYGLPATTSPLRRACTRRFAMTRSRASSWRLCTDPDFHPGRAWSDLLFTMSDNTHPAGEPAWARIDMLWTSRTRMATATHAHFMRKKAVSDPAPVDNRRNAILRVRRARRCKSSASSSQRRPIWWSQTGSNRRPHACKARALPTELWPPQRTDASNPRTEHRTDVTPDPTSRRADTPRADHR